MKGLLLGLSVLVLSSLSFARTAPNSFLNTNVTTVAGLMKEVKSDPVVRDRYRRHFAMNDQELYAYLSKLEMSKLTASGLYRVYAVPNNGVVRSRLLALKKGEPVFVDTYGNPILVKKCGNPMTRGPKDVTTESIVQPEAFGAPEEAKMLAEEMPSEEMFAEVVPSEPTPPIIALLPPAEVIETVGESPAAFVPGGLNLAPLLGLGALFSHSGDSSTNRTPPVPEPISMITFGAGLAGYAMRRRKK